MGKTGNPAKQAEERRISQIGDFKKRLGGVVELPSGLIVKVRNPGGMRAFMTSGVIPNSLMVIIQESLKSGKQADPADVVKDGQIDPEMLKDMATLMDSVAMQCIVEPKLHPVPDAEAMELWNLSHDEDSQIDDPEELRSDEKLYVDELPDDDKQFLFQWISGGTRDLEQFRREHDSNVAALADVAGAQAGAVAVLGSDAG